MSNRPVRPGATALVAAQPAQYDAFIGGGQLDTTSIAEGVWIVPIPMPDRGLRYTLSVAAETGSGALAIVDPGWPIDSTLATWDRFLQAVGKSYADISHIIVTHSHPDHMGAADEMQRRSGAEVLGHPHLVNGAALGNKRHELSPERLHAWGVSDDLAGALAARLRGASASVAPVSSPRAVEEGPVLGLGALEWQIVYTPGHTADHLSIVDPERRILISGDHALPMMHPGLGLSDGFDKNPIQAYLDTLDRLRAYEDHVILPAHGYAYRGLDVRQESSRSHVLRRADEVASIIEANPDLKILDIASRVQWSGGWESVVSGPMLFSALNQIDLYADFVAMRAPRDPDE